MNLIYLPCSCFNFAAYWACNFSSVWNYVRKMSLLKGKTYLSFRLFGKALHFHLFKFNIRFATADRKKKHLPRKCTYFLMLSCFVFFALAIDMATDLLAGGPTLDAVCADFPFE